MRLASKLVQGEKMREITRGLFFGILVLVVLIVGFRVSDRLPHPLSGMVVILSLGVSVYLILIAVKAKI
ncbi:MAG: hypothetical protein KBC15_02980 [Candidatus Levybacteria bacterium]|nr:hypothetical protein [Candidatus Levybacteria bacterium]